MGANAAFRDGENSDCCRQPGAAKAVVGGHPVTFPQDAAAIQKLMTDEVMGEADAPKLEIFGRDD